jgi:predicted DCC family thiol-disulfide oxidoreductase YuxK
MTATDRLMVLLDAQCPLCTRLGQYLTRHAPPGRFELVPIRCETGQRLIDQYAIPDPEGSFILIDTGHAYTKSPAVFRVARHLAAPARWVLILRILPRAWTNAIYDVIARNRRRIFKTPLTCARYDHH